ncbi:hypothetical protein O3V59_16710 [Brevibacillus thermoruber]|uniref:Uncharacterized protein n=1 Tax=Brevibacillus thermoruber TaxID=33942 RepID=A0A9X3TSG1_9BACL|nr:hypothetical protein [Brevibacillus thermoruber]MDA5110009.1 hypothetical protein [Brevibacillus thermoruber]
MKKIFSAVLITIVTVGMFTPAFPILKDRVSNSHQGAVITIHDDDPGY